MLKVGVFGVGHLGKFHLNNWKEITDVELVGFFDPDDTAAREVAGKYKLKRFPDAAAHDVAAAANAIVGLEPEYVPLAPPELSRFECDAGRQSYTLRSGRCSAYHRWDLAESRIWPRHSRRFAGRHG